MKLQDWLTKTKAICDAATENLVQCDHIAAYIHKKGQCYGRPAMEIDNLENRMFVVSAREALPLALQVIEKLSEPLMETVSSTEIENLARKWSTFADTREAQHFYEGGLTIRTMLQQKRQQSLAEVEALLAKNQGENE